MSSIEIPRYSRHDLLAVMDQSGREKMRTSRVLITGLGALGCSIASLLARAGVGFLRIVDMDRPELHNLHRQTLYTEADVYSGRSKAELAADHLRAANSEVVVEPVNERIGHSNISRLLEGIDLVMDALDDSTVRFIINDAIVERGTPYIFGGAVSTVGNALTIVPGKTPCLRCLWPDPAQIAGHASASQVGVLSTAAVVVAAVQTTEALKLLCGRSQDLFQGMLVFDLWNTGFHTAPVARDPNCMCAAAAKIDHKEAPRTWTP